MSERGIMNKIATYLNEHLLGEASSSKAMRRRYSRDGSILTITPEIVVFPRVTNDIRKVARFTWQLAEKGHPLGMTVRAHGADITGAAIGKGVVIDTSAHLRQILQVAHKDKLVHVQPGVPLEVVQETLRWHGLSLPQLPRDTCHTSVGGAIAGNVMGDSAPFSNAIEKLEVVLANGDLIETGRVSRHDVNKKLGLQTFEGEMYRKLTGILEDHEETIAQMAADPTIDGVGYRGIAKVRGRDGSIDLTPLFIGSQGTLGIISEVVLKTDYYNQDTVAAIIVAETSELGRDIADRVSELEPSMLMTIDGGLITKAEQTGKRFSLLGTAGMNGAIVYVEFNDYSDRARHGKIKKLRRLVDKMNITMIDSEDRDLMEFKQLLDITDALDRMADDDANFVPVIHGASVPHERREEFFVALEELSHKQHVKVSMVANRLTGVVNLYTDLKLSTVSDKQKIFRLMNEYAALVTKSGGAFISDGAEGRLKANAAWSTLDEPETRLFTAIREVFDPFSTLNPHVKQKNDMRSIVASLRTSFDTTDFIA